MAVDVTAGSRFADDVTERGVARSLLSTLVKFLVMTSLFVGAQLDVTRQAAARRRAIHHSASIGGSKILECDVTNYPADVIRSSGGGGGVQSFPAAGLQPPGASAEQIMTWRKQGHEVPIFIQFDGYPPHVDESYQGRIRLVETTAIEISDLRASDEGWYECSVVHLEVPDEGAVNGTWIYLAINAPPVLGEASPTFLIQKEGDTVDMFCEATATPAPSLTWRKDGRELSVSDRIRMYGNRVQLRRLERTDGGAYSCTFANVVGQVSHVIKLVVEGNAYIMVPPSNRTAKEGDRVKLTCQAEGFPNNITYRWYRDGLDVHQTAGLMSRAGVYADGSFVINIVNRDDAGWYTCRPTNGLGVAPEATAYLNVTYLPRVVAQTSRVYLPRGLTGRLDCPVEANPPATIILWAKNGQMIDVEDADAAVGDRRRDGSAAASINRRLHVSRQGSLFIRSVQDVDEGRYSCTPYSSLGEGLASLPIQVIVREAPYFTVRPNAFYQKQTDEKVELPCVAFGDPQPTITWKKTEGRFPPSTKTMLAGGNLTIAHLAKEEQGVYECIASNHVTSVVTSTLLIVEAAITHAAYNISVNTTHKSARVCWLPSYDGGQQLHHVLWYLMIQNSSSRSFDQWKTMQVVPNDTLCVTVYQLQPSTAYQFMVLSRNQFGDALYSKPVATSTKDDDGSYGDYGDEGDMGNDDTDHDEEEEEEEGDGEEEYEETYEYSYTAGATNSETAEVSGGNQLNIPSAGPKPFPPFNVSVQQMRAGLVIRWQPPRPGPVPVEHFAIQYRTVGQWVSLTDQVAANTTSFTWSTASRGALYHFRVFSVTRRTHSEPSHVVSLRTVDPMSQNPTVTNSLIGAVIGILLILAVTAAAVVVASKFIIRQRRRAKSIRYGNIKYFGPHQVEGNHNSNSVLDHVKNEAFTSDVVLNTELTPAPTAAPTPTQVTPYTNHVTAARLECCRRVTRGGRGIVAMVT